jgi:ribosome biogenesis protein Tsr3
MRDLYDEADPYRFQPGKALKFAEVERAKSHAEREVRKVQADLLSAYTKAYSLSAKNAAILEREGHSVLDAALHNVEQLASKLSDLQTSTSK